MIKKSKGIGLSQFTTAGGSVLIQTVFFALIGGVVMVHLFELNGDNVVGGATFTYPTAVT